MFIIISVVSLKHIMLIISIISQVQGKLGIIISVVSLKHIIPIISIISQVQVKLGIADHVWQEKRVAIAWTIDALGERFKPELQTGWFVFIFETWLRQLPQWEKRPWCLMI